MEKQLKKYLRNGKFDNVSKTRSHNMSSIRGKNNRSTEVYFKMLIVRTGIKGWVLHPKNVMGKPDFFFPKEKIAIFIDGCFWHGCPKCGHIPKTRSEFWRAKILRNQERDEKTTKTLIQSDIVTLRFWEHEMKNRDKLKSSILNLKQLLS